MHYFRDAIDSNAFIWCFYLTNQRHNSIQSLIQHYAIGKASKIISLF